MSAKSKMSRKPWVAWRVSDELVRVQIHEPAIAKAFAKNKGATLAGYGVAGGYLRLFDVPQSVAEVDAWMNRQTGSASAGRVMR